MLLNLLFYFLRYLSVLHLNIKLLMGSWLLLHLILFILFYDAFFFVRGFGFIYLLPRTSILIMLSNHFLVELHTDRLVMLL